MIIKKSNGMMKTAVNKGGMYNYIIKEGQKNHQWDKIKIIETNK